MTSICKVLRGALVAFAVLAFVQHLVASEKMVAEATARHVSYCSTDGLTQANVELQIAIRNSSEDSLSLDAIYAPSSYTLARSLKDHQKGRFEFQLRWDSLDNKTNPAGVHTLGPGELILVDATIAIPIGKRGLRHSAGIHYLSVTVPILIKGSRTYVSRVVKSPPLPISFTIPKELVSCRDAER
jgi:hypothetical protein